MVYAPPKYRLTVDEYQRMGEAGIFHEDDRVELLDGELYLMPPISGEHSRGVRYLDWTFNRRLGDRAIVDTQNPVRLSDYSEPQPDLVLLRPRADFYRTTPRPEDVLLLVEVAVSSLDYDRIEKLPRYARAGIPEVWIANFRDRQIEVYREPTADGYAWQAVYRPGDSVAPAAFPDVAIRVEEILG